MFPVETAISYFLHKKFSIFAALISSLEMIQKDKGIGTGKSKKSIEIENYEKSLRALPVSELEKMYQQALASDAMQAEHDAINKEKARFYNLQSANADFIHWAKAEHWTINEAVALSFAKEPTIVTWSEIQKLKEETLFAKDFTKRRQLVIRAKFNDETNPLAFIKWAKKNDIEFNADFVRNVEKMSEVVINWVEKYLELKDEYDALVLQLNNLQKTESTRKTENLLQLLAAIALDKFNFISIAERSPVPLELSNLMAKKGVSMTSQTIRGWLDNGVSLIRANSKKG